MHANAVLLRFATGLLGAVLAMPALACSCMPGSFDDALRSLPAIFEARIVDVAVDGAMVTATAETLETWIGSVPPVVQLVSSRSSAACGIFGRLPVRGERVLAMPHTQEGATQHLALCGGGVAWPDEPRDPRLLRWDAERRRLVAAVARDPDALTPRMAEAAWHLDWDPPGAVRAYDAIAAAFVGLPAPRIGAARALVTLRRFDEALQRLDGLEGLPGAAEAEALRGQARLLGGDRGVLATLRDFRGLVARELDLTETALPGADFGGARIPRFHAPRARLPGTRLDGARLGIELEAADLRGMSARGLVAPRARMRSTDLRGADLSDADLPNADLSDGLLGEARLTNAVLTGALLLRTDLRAARLDGINLEDGLLYGADLRGASLGGARLTGARYDCRTQFTPGFDPSAAGMRYFAGDCPVR